MKTFFLNLFDNRYAQKILLPIALYNMILSWLRIRKEHQVLIDTINENDDFFNSIATLGFKPTKTLPTLVSIMPFDKQMTLEDIEGIATKTIIAVILKFVKDENLLGVVHVDCKIEKSFVVTTLQPTSLKLFLIDLVDFAISTSVTLLAVAAYFILFN